MLQHLHIQFTQLLMEHKPGRMKTLFVCVYGRICVLSRNWTQFPHPVVVYFIHCSSLSLYSKNSLQYCFHYIFVHMYKELKAASCVYPYVFNARMKCSTTEKESTWCIVREMVLDTEVVTYLISRCSLYVIISSYNPLLWLYLEMCLSVTVFETSWVAQPNITLFTLWIQHFFCVQAWHTTQSILIAVIVGMCWWLLSSRQPILWQKLMAYRHFLEGLAAVQQVLPYSSQVSVWCLCEARTTGFQENVAVQNCEFEEMKEQFLHPFLRTATDRVAVRHSVTLVTITHMSVVILHNGQL
jgi:hypothetical protein